MSATDGIIEASVARRAIQFAGKVTPPPDMMNSARLSLSERAFADLMEQTGGQPPTPEQLCKMVDSVRQAAV